MNPDSASVLAPHHITYFTERAVLPAQAVAAGARSVSCAEAGKALGRQEPTAFPGILLPYPNKPTYARIRLDDGPDRYLAPGGIEVPIYIPPPGIDAPLQPIVVVEAPVKALALAGLGWFSVGLGGVSSTLVKGSHPAKLNASWGGVMLRGRVVVVLFDANLGKPHVAHGLARLSCALEDAGASVFVARLPTSAAKEDLGPDDFLALHGESALCAAVSGFAPADPVRVVQTALEGISRRDAPEVIARLIDDSVLIAAALERGRTCLFICRRLFGNHGAGRDFNQAVERFREDLARDEDAEASFAGMYRVEGGGIYCGERHLTNFTATIVQEVVTDNGLESEKRRALRIEGRAGDVAFPPVELDATTLGAEDWWIPHWGTRAQVSPLVRNARQHLLLALQVASTPTIITVYVHTGFREIDGRLVFLHAGGAVGGEAQTRLPANLGRFRLPDHVVDLPEAVRASLALLDVAPTRITVPLLLAAYRAPLNHWNYFDTVVHVQGTTGVFKSTLVALVQSHFGRFDDAKSLPGNFSSTPYAIEELVFAAKDVLVTIDDFKPNAGDTRDDAGRTMSWLLTLVGNRAPRNRLQWRDGDMASLPPRPPRGLVVTTGEGLPPRESEVARSFVIKVGTGDVDLEKVSIAQSLTAELAIAMHGYVAWLARRSGMLESWFEARFPDLRAALNRGGHARTPAAAAQLALAGELFVEFAVDSGVIAAGEEARALQERMIAGLSETSDLQTIASAEANPGRAFLEQLGLLIDTGGAQLSGKSERPVNENFVGWEVGTDVFLVGAAAYGVVCRSLVRQGQRFPLTPHVLWARLRDDGLIAPGDQPGRFTVRESLGGKRVHVIRLTPEAVATFLGGGGAPGNPGAGPESRADWPGGGPGLSSSVRTHRSREAR